MKKDMDAFSAVLGVYDRIWKQCPDAVAGIHGNRMGTQGVRIIA